MAESEVDLVRRPTSRAELYREIEKSPRTPHPAIDLERRLGSFDEVEAEPGKCIMCDACV